MARNYKVLTPTQTKWAYDKWCERYSLFEIAVALGVNEKTIYRALKGKERIKKPLIYDGEDSVEYGRYMNAELNGRNRAW